MIGNIQIYRPGVGFMQTAAPIVELEQGDALLISVTFEYRTTTETTCTLEAFIGPIADPAAKGEQVISLPVVADYTVKHTTVGVQTSDGVLGIGKTPPGTYNLLVRIGEVPDIYQEIYECITVKEKVGMLGNIGELLGMLVLVMMMGMMMPMMQGMGGNEEPKKTEETY